MTATRLRCMPTTVPWCCAQLVMDVDRAADISLPSRRSYLLKCIDWWPPPGSPEATPSPSISTSLLQTGNARLILMGSAHSAGRCFAVCCCRASPPYCGERGHQEVGTPGGHISGAGCASGAACADASQLFVALRPPLLVHPQLHPLLLHRQVHCWPPVRWRQPKNLCGGM